MEWQFIKWIQQFRVMFTTVGWTSLNSQIASELSEAPLWLRACWWKSLKMTFFLAVDFRGYFSLESLERTLSDRQMGGTNSHSTCLLSIS